MHVLALITPPEGEPVSLADAQEHIRAAAGGPDAALIGIYLQSARETVEEQTGRRLLPQTWELRLPAFPCGAIVLPTPPLIEVVSVRYSATDGTDTLLSAGAYQVAAPSGPTCDPGAIWPAADTDWPATRQGDIAAVRVRFRCGYADAATVPAMLRSALLLVLADLYENREAASPKRPEEVPGFVRCIAPYRVHWL